MTKVDVSNVSEELVAMIDVLLNDWMNDIDQEKSKKAWKKLRTDLF